MGFGLHASARTTRLYRSSDVEVHPMGPFNMSKEIWFDKYSWIVKAALKSCRLLDVTLSPLRTAV
jgi:hypothetical protein